VWSQKKKSKSPVFFFFFYLPTTEFSKLSNTFVAVAQEESIALDEVLPLIVKVEPKMHVLTGPLAVD
jgi:hypothetical protein